MKVRELRSLLFDIQDQDSEVMVSSDLLNHFNQLSQIEQVAVLSKGDDEAYSDITGVVIILGEQIPRIEP
ncbi:MAG: hypothetical protein WC479_09365 [Candidatus Izemoplasmatales bacterium]